MPLTNVSGPDSSGRQAATAGPGWRVNLGLLTSVGVQREANFATPRNIFAIPRADGSLPLDQEPVLENLQNSDSEETAVEQVEAEESPSYRYLGFLRMGERKQINSHIAVLRKGDEVMMLKVGDRVDGHVILRAITAESVIMRDTATRAEQTVLLSEPAEAGVGTEQTVVSSEREETVDQE